MRDILRARLRLLCIALSLLSFVPEIEGRALPRQLETACRPYAERTWECAHRSAALRHEALYILVLPERLSTAPTLVVLLHGSGRNHRTLIEQSSTRETLAASPHVILMPEGGASWWIAPGFQEHVVELTEFVARAFGIPPARRGCGGWSMGAFGSIRLIEQYPHVFTSWTGILGLLDFPNPGYPERDNHTVPAPFGPRREWSRHNPMHAAAALRGKRLWFATGKDAFDYRMNLAFDQRLKDLRIPHEFATLPGGHVFTVVAEALPRALRFHERVLGDAHAH